MKQIALTKEELTIVTNIMKSYPHTVVFGSRAKGTHKQFSDLDLCIKDHITGYEYELLKEAFEQSNLPYTVDLVLYTRCDDSFKKIIDRDGIPLTATTINLLEIYKKQLLDIIEKHLPDCKVILFGSRAAGTQREGSDIDIALDMGSPISFDSILDIYVDLDESTIPVKVDLVDIHSADEKIKQEILKKGIIWKA